MGENALLIRVDSATAIRLRRCVEDARVDETSSADGAEARLEGVRRFGVVVLGADLDDPIRVSQRLAALQHDLSVLILCRLENVEAVPHAVRSSPFLSSSVVSRSTEDQRAVVNVFEDLVAQVRQRRRYSVMLESVQDQLPQPDAAQRSAPLYLDTLLDHAPIGVALVDDGNHVLEWNTQASAIFGIQERSAIGQSVTTLFPEYERKRMWSTPMVTSTSTGSSTRPPECRS